MPIYLAVVMAVGMLYAIAAALAPPIQAPIAQDRSGTTDGGGQRDAPETWETFVENPTAFSTVVVAFFTAALTLTAFLQLRSLSHANETARVSAEAAKLSADALVSAERAHLFVRIHAQSVQQQITNASMPGDDWNAGYLEPPLHVSYVIKNFGKTPAILREISHTLDIFELPDEAIYSPSRGLPDQRVLGSDAETMPIWCDCLSVVTVGQAREVAMGKLAVWLVGRVIYEDIITGQTHTEPFLYRYAGDGFEADYRPSYNLRT